MRDGRSGNLSISDDVGVFQMINYLLPAIAVLVMSGVGARFWYRSWRKRRIVANRRIEAPNSHYSSTGVRNQEDRQRWGDINTGVLHPLNADEVGRLLEVVDVDGVKSLSSRDRLFLDNMTVPRLAM
jgi:hypothetical protein